MKPSPFLRWAGGKRQLLPVIHEVFTSLQLGTSSRYFEPFIGGGAVFFSLANVPFGSGSPKKFIINDANEELTNLYKVVKEDVEHLISLLQGLATDISEEAFYKIRGELYQDSAMRAARFVFLNRLCFNGLYRVNRAGLFNVPYGRLKNPMVCNEELLRTCSIWLNDTEILNTDFETALKGVKSGDVVYLDPPYVALSKTASFSSYHSTGFGLDDHERLATIIENLTALGAYVLLSNSDTEITRDLFSNLNLYSVQANRSISASGKSRSRVSELIATNFPISNASDLLTVV